MANLVQRSDVGEFRKRYRWFVVVILTVFFSYIGRLFYLQILKGDVHEAQARKNIVAEKRLATTRGVIRDAQGKILASNRASYSVYAVPEQLDLETDWPLLKSYLKLDEPRAEEMMKKLLSLRAHEKRKSQQALLFVDVDRDIVATIETHQSELPGVTVLPSPVRSYPYGELGAHLLGYMREVDAETLAERQDSGYRAGDRFGAVGIERRWESYLRGQRGYRRFIRKKTKRERIEELEERYLGEGYLEEPTPGRDISLTLDIDLVKSAEQAMRGQLAGAVVVVDVRTGRLLAALSKPSFDPNAISGGRDRSTVQEAFNRYFSDPLSPTLDRTMSAAYPPGSTYKPFSALTGLEEGVIDPNAQVDCHGGYEYGKRYFRCTGVHRRVNLHFALVQSCNSYFYDLGSKVQIDQLEAVGKRFGFGEKTGIGVNPEARGRMPTRAWYTRQYKGAFRGGFTLLAAIGQGATTVNVLQLGLAYAALANGGTLYRPQVVRSIETSDGTVVQDFPPRVKKMLEYNQSYVSIIRDGLVGVVAEKKGTAHAMRIEGVDMAGKTGTAQVSQVAPRGSDQTNVQWSYRDHAWFAGYAPSASPEIAIIVLVEHGGGGGKNAAPVAMKVVRDWQRLKAERLGKDSSEKAADKAGKSGDGN